MIEVFLKWRTRNKTFTLSEDPIPVDKDWCKNTAKDFSDRETGISTPSSGPTTTTHDEGNQFQNQIFPDHSQRTQLR